MARDYARMVAGPWRLMKLHAFGGLETRLHAADLKAPTEEQMEAVGRVFREGQFFRVAAVVKKSSEIGPGFRSTYEATAMMLLRHLAAVMGR